MTDIDALVAKWRAMLGTQFTPTETALVHETMAALTALSDEIAVLKEREGVKDAALDAALQAIPPDWRIWMLTDWNGLEDSEGWEVRLAHRSRNQCEVEGLGKTAALALRAAIKRAALTDKAGS